MCTAAVATVVEITSYSISVSGGGGRPTFLWKGRRTGQTGLESFIELTVKQRHLPDR